MSLRTPARRAILGAALLIAAYALLVRFAVAPGQAAAGWLAPVDISAPGTRPLEAQIAIDARGGAVAVWSSLRGVQSFVQAAERPAGGAWQPPTEVAPAGHDPQVAVDARGDAFAVWERYSRGRYVVQAAIRPAGAAWSRPVDLSAASAQSTRPRIAVDPRGDAVAAWSSRAGGVSTVQAARRPASGPWRRPVDIARAASRRRVEFGGVDVAIANGNAVAVWERFVLGSERTQSTRVQAATSAAGRRWRSPVSPAAAGRDASSPDVAAGERGGTVAVWVNGPSAAGMPSRIQGSWLLANGRWGARANLSPAGREAGQPRVAVDAHGTATSIWNHADLGGKPRLLSAVGEAGGRWQAAVDVVAPGEIAGPAELAVGARGDAFAIWDRVLSLRAVDQRRNFVVRAARRAPGGGWQAPVDLSAVSFPEGSAKIAIDPAGGAVAIWSRLIGGATRVQSVDYAGG